LHLLGKWHPVTLLREVITIAQSTCITAFSHATFGIIILPATLQICDALTRLASALDKRPDLTNQLRSISNADQGEGRKSLVEATAEAIQRAFTICLTERTSSQSGVLDGKPEGKKSGIYSFANLVLRLLFQVRSLDSLERQN
jgi:hypothetical protein